MPRHVKAMDELLRTDLAVVGAGPAGTAAAAAAAACGLNVVLLGQSLRHAPAGVRALPGHLVWSVTPGFRIEAIGPAGRIAVEAERLVAATGTLERHVLFPGWTLPGVTGLSAAAAPDANPATAVGQRVIVAGCGPLLAAAICRLQSHGAEIVAALTLSGTEALPVPAALPGHAVRQAAGAGVLQRVQIGPVDAEGRPCGEAWWVEADRLYVGYGLLPATDIPSLLRAPHHFDTARGGWIPLLDADGRTAILGLYAAGGTAGILDRHSAMSSGRRAGHAAARDAGRTVPQDDEPHAAIPPASPIASIPGLIDNIPPETIVCPCEGTTRATIEAAIADGAHEMNQVKHFTRCGMGECQGRLCAHTVAALLARHVGGLPAAGRWTMRPPLRPVPLEALLGTFAYTDIPVPHPAPL